MADKTHPTLAQHVPAKWRSLSYAVGSVAGAVYVAIELAYGAPQWLTVAFAGFSATGFYVARGNTSA